MKSFKEFLGEMNLFPPRTYKMANASVSRLHSHKPMSFGGEYQWVNSSSYINDSLMNDRDMPDMYKEIDHNMSSSIKNSAPTERPHFLYHGAGFDPKKMVLTGRMNQNEDGKIVMRGKGYLSTTPDITTSTNFSRGPKHILRIHVPKGSRIGNIGKNHHLEPEVIIHKGHEIHIDPKPRVLYHQKNYSSAVQEFHIWDAHLHHDGT